MIKSHDFVCQHSLENDHFNGSQLEITESQNTLSVNSHSAMFIDVHWEVTDGAVTSSSMQSHAYKGDQLEMSLVVMSPSAV